MMNTFTDFVLDEQETEKQVKEAKINQAILGWFESWQSWQQRMLISGIVSRFNEAQLECLLVAVEPVFHRDFVTSVKKVYPIYDAGQTKVSMNPEEDGKINKKMWILKKQIQKTIGKEKINIYEDEIKEVEDVHLGRISSEHTVEASLPFANARARPVRRGSSADSMTSLSTIEEGSSKRDTDETGEMSALDEKIAEEDLDKMETPDLMECEKLEDDDIQNSMTSQLVCHLMSEVRSSGTSQVSTLVSSLSPIEETSPEASSSMDTEKSTPVGMEEETLFGDSLTKLKPEEKKESKKKKKKKKQKKKVDPDTAVEKLVSSSSWAERVLQSASNKSVEEIMKREESILDFRSGPASVDVRVDDFFEKRKNDILGKPVSTRSKVGVSFKQTYDTRRNPLPIPTTQQLYKSKKFWEGKTVKARTGRLKEQFQQQLVEIWTWLADWPAYQRIRLLLLLFSHSGEEMVKYAAECVKHKSRQLEGMKSSIDILSDPMLLSIFQHLNPCDLLQASNVCKRWNYLLQSDAVWMKKCEELAMSVRFVTKRFIGEYDPTLENIYQHTCVVGGNTVLFEVMDTAGQEENEVMMEEKIRWADAFLLVYAINDQTSFDEIPRLKFTISHTMSQLHHKTPSEPVITVVGNKNDLEPDRMVDRAAGEQVAQSLRSQFCEISVRDGIYDVMKVFEETYIEYRRRTLALHAMHDGASNFKRKEKSFKYVDRIPRMQGRKRHYIINDVSSSDMMMSKIDECSEDLENKLRLNGDPSHKHSQRLPNGRVNGHSADEPAKPPMGRRRRNAVVGFGSSKSISDNTLLTNGHATEGATAAEYGLTRQRRHTLTAPAYMVPAPTEHHNSADEEKDHVPMLTRHHTLRQFDANDTNNNITKAHHRRCRSQEVMDINGSQILEGFPHNITRYVGKRVA